MGRTALVMSGGGAKGAFELGAADYLIRDLGIDPAVIVGVSTGNLNAAMLAQGEGWAGLLRQLDALKAIWYGLRENRDIYTTRVGGVLGLVFKADSIYSNKPLGELIRRHVDPARIRASGRTLRVGVVELLSGEYFAVDGAYPGILEMILASASIPVMFNPVEIEGRKYVDGGVRNITPLSEAFQALEEERDDAPGELHDPDTIYVILASPLEMKRVSGPEKVDSGIEIALRSVDLLLNEVFRNDLKLAAAINAGVKFCHELKVRNGEVPDGFPFAGFRYADLVLIRPDVLHMGSLEFDPRKIRRAFQDGREKAAGAVAEATAAGGSNVTLDMLGRDARVIGKGGAAP